MPCLTSSFSIVASVYSFQLYGIHRFALMTFVFGFHSHQLIGPELRQGQSAYVIRPVTRFMDIGP